MNFILRSFLLCALFVVPVLAQTGLDDSLSSRLNAIRTKYSLAGISVSVIRHGKILANGSAGLADIARSIPITDSSAYRVASISKTVAATALMQLYEAGKFTLDQDISPALGFTLRNPYYPDVPITYRMILSHTAGIVDGSGYDGFLAATSSSSIPPISSVLVAGGTHYTADTWLNKRPGSYFTYTNLGFGVVGTLVESLSQERFDRYCVKHIFEPLGLDAGFSVHDLRNLNNLAVLYRASGNQWNPQLDNYQGIPPAQRDLSAYVIGSNGSLFGPQGNLRISAKDLAVFMIARSNGGTVNGKRILNDSTAALMNTPMWSYNGSNGNNYYGLFRRWGLGTHLTTNAAMGDIVVAGKTMAGHPGEAYGLISDAYVDLGNSFGIIFITNGKKGAYAFGSTSAFYDVEEDVFAAAYGLIVSAPTAVPASEGNIPTGTVIRPNHPNPFNPTTNIQFTVDRTDRAVLTVYTMLGQQIATLFDGTAEAGKIYSTRWTGAGLASGPYIAQLEHSGSVVRNRMLLIK
ncbi:MAG: beta-lactamase family protein [Bacteroidetes bacterium]|nr:beta-lactamase family protein [Bacteroidota bacterium]